jgi:hypothetical protein
LCHSLGEVIVRFAGLALQNAQVIGVQQVFHWLSRSLSRDSSPWRMACP